MAQLLSTQRQSLRIRVMIKSNCVMLRTQRQRLRTCVMIKSQCVMLRTQRQTLCTQKQSLPTRIMIKSHCVMIKVLGHKLLHIPKIQFPNQIKFKTGCNCMFYHSHLIFLPKKGCMVTLTWLKQICLIFLLKCITIG